MQSEDSEFDKKFRYPLFSSCDYQGRKTIAAVGRYDASF
jgi:hypothetical protein